MKPMDHITEKSEAVNAVMGHRVKTGNSPLWRPGTPVLDGTKNTFQSEDSPAECICATFWHSRLLNVNNNFNCKYKGMFWGPQEMQKQVEFTHFCEIHISCLKFWNYQGWQKHTGKNNTESLTFRKIQKTFSAVYLHKSSCESVPVYFWTGAVVGIKLRTLSMLSTGSTTEPQPAVFSHSLFCIISEGRFLQWPARSWVTSITSLTNKFKIHSP